MIISISQDLLLTPFGNQPMLQYLISILRYFITRKYSFCLNISQYSKLAPKYIHFCSFFHTHPFCHSHPLFSFSLIYLGCQRQCNIRNIVIFEYHNNYNVEVITKMSSSKYLIRVHTFGIRENFKKHYKKYQLKSLYFRKFAFIESHKNPDLKY